MDKMVTVVDVICPFCGKSYGVTVPVKGFLEWQGGMPIQRAMPSLSADDREALISGICPECWTKTFG